MTDEGEAAFSKLIEFATIFLRIILSMSLICFEIYASEVDKYRGKKTNGFRMVNYGLFRTRVSRQRKSNYTTIFMIDNLS